MNLRQISQLLIIATVVLLIGYDFLPFATPVAGDTLSEVMRDVGMQSKALPFGWGFLAGHFFVQLVPRRLTHTLALTTASGVALVLHVTNPPAGVALLLGVLAGAVLWPLERAEATPPK
jgi:hypothetical protein